MISKVEILAGKDSIVHECWGRRKFQFTDGVNLIFGPNGCGKTVLMNTISHYAGIEERGWSAPLSPFRISGWMDDNKGKNYMDLISDSCKLGKIKMEWDGVAAYKSDTSRDSMGMLTNLMQGGRPEELELGEAMSLKMSNVSAGQKVAFFINRLTKLKVPDLREPGHTNSNDTWQFYGKLLADHVKKLPRDGKPTLLMDEPDKSLDYKAQEFFWNTVVDALAKKWQIIIVTHSVFALGRTKDNIIDKDNYFKNSREAVKKAISL